jgi:hypothetical protein
MFASYNKRVIIIINKGWECDPIISVLLNDYARPASELGWPDVLNYPYKRNKFRKAPRGVFNISTFQVEIWCISDLLTSHPDSPHFQSSSERKMEQIGNIFEYSNQPINLVIAVGTAASYPPEKSLNGSVICGTKAFLHNIHPNGTNPFSNWESGPFDTIIKSSLKVSDFTKFTDFQKDQSIIFNRFLVPPLNPDPLGGRLYADYNYVALSMINVTNASEYSEMDRVTAEAYQKCNNAEFGKSIETTHGLIRVAAGEKTPFLFISGITDRGEFFKEDVEPRPYSQRTSCAHNAGIVLAWMLPKITNP